MKTIYSLGAAVALTISAALPLSVSAATPQTGKSIPSAQIKWEQQHLKTHVKKKGTQAVPQSKKRLTQSTQSNKEKIVYSSFIFEEQGLYLVNPDGSNPVKIVDGWSSSGTITPDGSKIIFVGYDEKEDNDDLYSINVDGTGLTQITHTPQKSESYPHISPDGKKIVYSIYYDDSFTSEIYVMDIDGSGVQPLTNNSELLKTVPNFSPDGKKIVYSVLDLHSFNNDTYIMDYDGKNQRNISNTSEINEDNPRWSPDGSLISFSIGQNVYVSNPDGSGLKQVTNFKEHENGNVFSAIWSPDAKKFVLVYVRGDLESPSYINTIPIGGFEADFNTISTEGSPSDWGFVK